MNGAPLSPAYTAALQRWRAQAFDILNNPHAPLSQRKLAWRFLKENGVM